MPRLPEITAPNKEAQPAYDYLVKTRGAARGGFAVMLASPDVAQRMAHVGTYVRFESSLPPNIRELATVVISAEMENPAEYTVHAKHCRELGVSEAAVKAALERAPVSGASADEKLAIDFTRELGRSHKLSDATFEAARKRLGDKGVVDLIAAIGYYAMLAVCHVALDIKPRS
jgi:4-carboxymuconolactone decarboxylase